MHPSNSFYAFVSWIVLCLYACGSPAPPTRAANPKKPSPVNVNLWRHTDRHTWAIVWGTEKKHDTLLTAIPLNAPCTLRTTQLDGHGPGEVLLEYRLVSASFQTGNQTDVQEETLQTVNEVWSLEKKQKLFSAISCRLYKLSTRNGPHNPWRTMDSVFYRYRLAVNDNGRLLISGLATYNTGHSFYSPPDHPQGTYLLNDTAMIWHSDRKNKKVSFQPQVFTRFEQNLNNYALHHAASDSIPDCRQYVLRFVKTWPQREGQLCDTVTTLCEQAFLQPNPEAAQNGLWQYRQYLLGSRYCIVEAGRRGSKKILFYYERLPL